MAGLGEFAKKGPLGRSKAQHWLQSGGAALCRFHAPHTRHSTKLSNSRHWALAQQLRSSNGSQMYEVFRHPAAAATRALPAFLALGGDMVAFSFSARCTSLRSAQATRELWFPLKPILLLDSASALLYPALPGF